MKAWWGKLSGFERGFLLFMTPGLLFLAVAFAMGGLRAVGILPPSTYTPPSYDRPKFKLHECWWRETEARYGSQVAMEDLSDDAQFQIIRECSRQQRRFEGVE